ncbi:hypothetical protein IFM89_030709 [Coptis chinensis]|uniref:RING-type E3 ubiquitin transferase n=1 Tax=Coptis chinensis TaxID=261450 RepID=A0A835IXS2_9MAGN|nr:hypothetical protein IFM89_030709 [Coptis chinensis]
MRRLFFKECLRELQCSRPRESIGINKRSYERSKGNFHPIREILIKITESLGLTSNQELLVESVTLEKERARSLLKELEAIDQIVNLIAHIRDWTAKLEQFSATNGVPIPPYFRCPIVIWGLMLDLVIVASGQTYERAFIQRWVDNGLTICPKTRQDLAHAHLITNYTVKDLIANWCEDNNIRRDTANGNNASPLPISSNVPSQDFTRAESFRCCFYSNNSTPSGSNRATNPCFKSKCEEQKRNGRYFVQISVVGRVQNEDRSLSLRSKALVDLLESGTLRWKKDACYYFVQSIHISCGAVKHLIELMDPDIGMIDKCVVLLANLSTIPEGLLAITREGGISLLVEVLETGSQMGKENL